MNSLDTLSHNNSQRTKFFEKAQTARLALQNATRLWLYLPAYIALLVALGAACRALAHFITNNDVTVYLWATLIFNSAVSIGVQCGSDVVRYWSSRARVLLIFLLPISALLFNATVLAPLEAEAEINATVSLLVGWTALLCVLLIGMRYGSNTKGVQRVPFSAPLVPALSLFGLLNSLSVDTLVQICFVIFVAAALYLIAYERMLIRVLKGDGSQRENISHNLAAPGYSGQKFTIWQRGQDSLAKMQQRALARAAGGHLIACVVWFAVFMGGAALFYYPVAAVIPRVLGVPLSAVRSASATLLDWRGSGSTVELRGGNYPLSDREVLKVEIIPSPKGVSTTPELWRGRIYENYSNSRWSANERPDYKSGSLRLKRGVMTQLAQLKRQIATTPELGSSPSAAKTGASELLTSIPFEAVIEPQRFNMTALYFPGELTAVQGISNLDIYNDGTYAAPASYRAIPYAIRANLKQKRLSALKATAGLSPTQLKSWRGNRNLAGTLQVDANLKLKLVPILAQVKNDALGRPNGNFNTPQAKANAIRDYLAKTCTYSLASPLVPADQDAVFFFLTNSKSGACDMFASAMAMLLRASDVPARLATGYIQPEDVIDAPNNAAGNLDNQNLDNKKQGPSFLIRERDAHAWVEYYVPGAGWLSYDPTQGTRTTEIPVEAKLAGIFNLPNLHLDFKTLWLPALGLLLIVAGLGWSFFDFRSVQKSDGSTEEELQRARIVESYERAVALLSRRVPKRKSQTPLEYEAAIQNAKIAERAKQEFSFLTDLLMAARYQRQSPQSSAEELQASLARLRRAL